MHTRLSVTCLSASLLVELSPNALAISTKPGGSVTQLFRAPLNDRPGTDVAVVMVDYPPGGSTPPHEHPGFVYAYEKHTEYLPIEHSTPASQPDFRRWRHRARSRSPSPYASWLRATSRSSRMVPLALKELASATRNLRSDRARDVARSLRACCAARADHIRWARERLAQMRRALEQAMARHGQIVPVVAEAGTEKSRLFYECKATIPAECKVLEAYSVSHGKASAGLPLLELLHQGLV
jgi:hypothetical protein